MNDAFCKFYPLSAFPIISRSSPWLWETFLNLALERPGSFPNFTSDLQATVHFDTILTRNAVLREEIETLQCQKAIFEGIYSRLHKKLEQQKKTMNTSIEQSTQAYEQRWGGGGGVPPSVRPSAHFQDCNFDCLGKFEIALLMEGLWVNSFFKEGMDACFSATKWKMLTLDDRRQAGQSLIPMFSLPNPNAPCRYKTDSVSRNKQRELGFLASLIFQNRAAFKVDIYQLKQ